jgi:hypothetical protein
MVLILPSPSYPYRNRRTFSNTNVSLNIDNGAVNAATSLSALTLSSNLISSVPANAFTGLTRLTSLSLAANQISALPVGWNNGLTALRYVAQRRTLLVLGQPFSRGGERGGLVVGRESKYDKCAVSWCCRCFGTISMTGHQTLGSGL